MSAAPRPHEPAALPKVLEFLSHLWAVHHALQAASKGMQRRWGVTGLQRLVVRVTGHRPGISAGELAAVLHVHPSTLTGVLGRLVARGFLARTADPSDKRRALFGLTAAGRHVDRTKSGTVEAAVARALGGVPQHKLAAAGEVLRAIERELGALRP